MSDTNNDRYAALATVSDQLSAEEARDLTDRIKVGVEAVWVLVKQAYESRAWAALGYASWDDYCTREFGSSRIRLPREERQEVVASLRESGLSIRAIAAAVGIGNQTVQDDLKQVYQTSTPAPPSPEEEQQVTTGTDGKCYPAKSPAMERLEQAKKNNPVEPPSFKSRAAVEGRIARYKEMADEGYTSRQIAREIGIEPDAIAGFRERHGLEVPTADAAMVNTRRLDFNRMVEEAVTTLEVTATALDLVDRDQLDGERLNDWATSLTSSTRSLNRFVKQIKEMTQ